MPQGERRWQPVAGGDRKNADSVLIAALASGATVRDASALARVGERTAYRRLDDPDFKRRIADARAEMLARAVGTLADASTRAASTLNDLLDAEHEGVALGA